MTIYPVIAGSCLSLSRYATLIGYSECSFFGISDESVDSGACRSVWTKYQRDTIADYIQDAIAQIENVVGYPICSRWIVAEDHKYSNPVTLNFGKLLSLGTQVTSIIQDSAAVSLLTDPATVTIATAITSTDDIHVFYPDTDIEIIPSSIMLSGGNLVISIPKCRLVEYSKLDNPVQGWLLSDPTILQTTVDVVQYSNDATSQAILVSFPSACDEACDLTETSVCAYIDNAEVGIIRLGKQDSSTCLCTTSPSRVKINYRAGLAVMTKPLESAIVRLAHSLMPTEPCGCDVTQRLWKRDRNVPQILDRERLNCPFGLSDGAWVAWRYALSIAQYRMTEFSGGQ